MRRISYSPDTIVKLPNIFGDGSDGTVTISSNTTLTRDMLYENLTINSGVTVTLAGYRIFCRTSFRNLGTVSANGANGSGTAGAPSTVGITVPEGRGGPGGLQSQANGTNGNNIQVGLSSNLNRGGRGGDAGIYLGGAAGESTYTEVNSSVLNNLENALSCFISRAQTLLPVGGGASGGSGANATGAAVTSGAAGAGGGVVVISAKTLDNTNGTITARGGNGSAATGTGNGGGGGGGAGGIIILIGIDIVQGTTTTTGGSGGAGVGTGASGAAGGNGATLLVEGA